MATTHPTRTVRTASDRSLAVALLVAYLGIVGGLIAAATLSAVYLVTFVPLGLGGLLVLAGAWVGVVVTAPRAARRGVEAIAERIEDADADAPAVDPTGIPATTPE